MPGAAAGSAPLADAGRNSAGDPVRILFLTDNFPPEVNAPASRTFEHAREWVRAGHQVTVITCAPNYPMGKVFPGYRNRLWAVEEKAGIRVVRVWTYVAANSGVVRRTLDYLSFMLAATVAGTFVRRPDLVIATSPQFFTACAGYLASRLRRVPFVFELRDLWPESIEAVGALRGGWGIRAIRWLEHFLYRKARAIVTVTHSFRHVLADRGIDARKIHVVTNGADLSRFRPKDRDLDLVRRLDCQGKFIAGYVGTHGMAHALETLLMAARILQERPEGRDVVILFVGDGAAKAQLQRSAAAMGLRNVRFVDTVPKEEIPDYWSLLDVAIVHLRKTPLFETVIPSKIFEAFAMGTPILLGVRGEARQIVEETGSGFAFEPEDHEQLAGRLLQLALDRAALNEAKAGCAAGARRYDRSRLAADMLDVITQIVRGSPEESRQAASKASRQEELEA